MSDRRNQRIEDRWEAIVVGAGPAGALTAYLLARRGIKTLLIDKAPFPRDKICGCCLSAKALRALESVGLDNLLDKAGAIDLQEMRLFLGPRAVSFPIASKSLSRRVLDSSLVDYAIAAGANFVSGFTASAQRADNGSEWAPVFLREVASSPTGSQTPSPGAGEGTLLHAKVVIIADGLAGTSVSAFPELAPIVASDSHIGSGAISHAAPDFYRNGTIYMTYGDAGYMGLVRLEDGSTDIAAALNPKHVRQSGSLSKTASYLLAHCHLPEPADLHSLPWRGTVALTRRRPRVAVDRIFVIGDSASYVEPFTGEGITWALASASIIAELIPGAVRQWHPKFAAHWQMAHRIIEREQSVTKVVAGVLRYPNLVRIISKLIDVAPKLSTLIARLVSSPDDKKEQHGW